MLFLIVWMGLCFPLTGLADQAVDLYDPAAPDLSSLDGIPPLVAPSSPLEPPLFSSGPVINSPRTGVGGADESILQTVSLRLNTYGFGCQDTYGNWLADDFTIPDGVSWTLSSVTFYLYQTNSSTTSTITGITTKIYGVSPDTSGATPIAQSSKMLSSTWFSTYRVSETSSGTNASRPIMAATVDMEGLKLPPGTYWLVWQASGSLISGPWHPALTIDGESATGNGLQYIGSFAAWYPSMDSGAGTQQGFPFLIHGVQQRSATVPLLNPLGMALYVFLTGLVATCSMKKKRVG